MLERLLINSHTTVNMYSLFIYISILTKCSLFMLCNILERLYNSFLNLYICITASIDAVRLPMLH